MTRDQRWLEREGKKWATRLGLFGWDLTFTVVTDIEEIEGNYGLAYYSIPHRIAEIKILFLTEEQLSDPENTLVEERYDPTRTLVHELLHCKFPPNLREEDTQLFEQTINDIANGLVEGWSKDRSYD